MISGFALSQLVCMLELGGMDLHVTDGWVGHDSSMDLRKNMGKDCKQKFDRECVRPEYASVYMRELYVWHL